MVSSDSTGPAPLDDSNIRTVYPEWLALRQVHVVFRHGERSPVYKGVIPAGLNKLLFCQCLRDHGSFKLMEDADVKSDLAGLPHLYFNSSREAVENGLVSRTAGVAAGLAGSHHGLYECSTGELTYRGHVNMMERGRQLAALYRDKVGFMPAGYDPKFVYLRSTSYARTLQSLRSLVSGMYGDGVAGKDLYVHVRKEEHEPLHPTVECPELKLRWAEYQKAFDTVNAGRLDHFHKLWNKIWSEHSVPNDPAFALHLEKVEKRIYRFYDTMACIRAAEVVEPREFEMARSIRNCVDDATFEDMQEFVSMRRYGMFKDPRIARVGIGSFIKELGQRMQSAASGKADSPSMLLYAAHDDTVAPLLAAFQCLERKYPTFGSHVIFELLEERKSGILSLLRPSPIYVRMKYNNEVITIPHCNVERRGLGNLCPLDEFMKLVKAVSPADRLKECRECIEPITLAAVSQQ